MQRTLALIVAILLAALAPALANQEPAYIVIDANEGRVLLHSEADQPWYPASVTKMMTAYVAFRSLRAGELTMTSPVRISQNALNQAPSKMGFKVGTILNIDNALKMMLVKSANDIAVAVAETVGGSEAKFVALMNAEAARLGMASTHFNNPNGLPDDGQVTTARDLAVLARAVWAEFPEYRDYFRIPAIRSGKKILRSANDLLEHYRGTTGMKTGFICASGFNIVASAERNGRTLITVVLGAQSSQQRGEAAARLMTQGFASWFGATKPDLATFRAGPARGAPVNLREQICGKAAAAARAEVNDSGDNEDPWLTSLGRNSSLVPRFVLMEPVQVYTGRADPMPGSSGGGIQRGTMDNVPMPHFRPRQRQAADNMFAPAFGDDAAPLSLAPN